MLKRWILPACAFLLTVGAAAAATDNPPAPSHVDPAVVQLLRRVDAVYTRNSTDKQALVSGYRLRLRLSSSLLNGSVDIHGQGKNALADVTAGAFHFVALQRGSMLWTRETNGLLQTMQLPRSAVASRNGVISGALFDIASYKKHPALIQLLPAAPAGSAALPGLTWLRLQIPQGQPVIVGISKTTSLVSALVFESPRGSLTLNISQWHKTSAGYVPGHLTLDGFGRDLANIEVLAFERASVAPHTFDPLVAEKVTVAAPISVPLSADEHLRYLAPVSIHGHLYRFGIDSSAPRIVLDTRTAAALHLANKQTIAPNESSADLDGFSIATAHFGPQRVSVRSFADAPDGTHLDGVLGFPFFAQAALILDPGTSTLEIGAPGELPLHGEKMTTTVSHDRIVLPVHFTGLPRPADLTIATSSLATVELEAAYTRANPNIFAPAAASATLQGLQIGALPVLTDVPASIVGQPDAPVALLPDAGALGLGFLRDYRTGFDVQHNIVSLEPLVPVPGHAAPSPQPTASSTPEPASEI